MVILHTRSLPHARLAINLTGFNITKSQFGHSSESSGSACFSCSYLVASLKWLNNHIGTYSHLIVFTPILHQLQSDCRFYCVIYAIPLKLSILSNFISTIQFVRYFSAQCVAIQLSQCPACIQTNMLLLSQSSCYTNPVILLQ